VKAQELANITLKEQKDGSKVDFYPDRFNKTIDRYLEDMND
jgi:valyl-tRNA synthetase